MITNSDSAENSGAPYGRLILSSKIAPSHQQNIHQVKVVNTRLKSNFWAGIFLILPSYLILRAHNDTIESAKKKRPENMFGGFGA
jgi:hypothetical protein